MPNNHSPGTGVSGVSFGRCGSAWYRRLATASAGAPFASARRHTSAVVQRGGASSCSWHLTGEAVRGPGGVWGKPGAAAKCQWQGTSTSAPGGVPAGGALFAGERSLYELSRSPSVWSARPSGLTYSRLIDTSVASGCTARASPST